MPRNSEQELQRLELLRTSANNVAEMALQLPNVQRCVQEAAADVVSSEVGWLFLSIFKSGSAFLFNRRNTRKSEERLKLRSQRPRSSPYGVWYCLLLARRSFLDTARLTFAVVF